MRSALLSGMNPNRLRLSLLLFFLALLIPTVVLIMQAYSQLKWEAFHHHQVEAESLAGRINEHLSRLIEREERRPFADFHFLVVEGDSSSNFLQRSPLSAYPVDSEIPGLIGFFQVDSVGRFSTPLLPLTRDSNLYGVSLSELSCATLCMSGYRRFWVITAWFNNEGRFWTRVMRKSLLSYGGQLL